MTYLPAYMYRQISKCPKKHNCPPPPPLATLVTSLSELSFRYRRIARSIFFCCNLQISSALPFHCLHKVKKSKNTTVVIDDSNFCSGYWQTDLQKFHISLKVWGGGGRRIFFLSFTNHHKFSYTPGFISFLPFSYYFSDDDLRYRDSFMYVFIFSLLSQNSL